MKFKLLSSFLLISVLLAGCVNEKKATTYDYQKIRLELIEKKTLEEGISYSIKLINGSDFVIKQNNVFVSFPIKYGEAAYKGNEYKVEAKGNKLDIQPGEKVTLDLFMPFEGIGDKSLLGIDNPSIQLIGYIETVDNKHQFSVGGDLIKN
ncbi:hypothetical protein WQ54_12705 [Bacillus sp. SA1-12]|uniref:hypothetical protein n=1 Tax=Bacillus sp. SA1-12 TaxID=1455638 RepID=UPI00062581C6|nr:hypothetical protein [Bacillus sp. SA1-12]KKI91825.1 hypothetical protein WQ54_12705 [Bacillus sp. SA1-12]